MRHYIVCKDESILADLYSRGLIGAWNGAYESDGSAVLAVNVYHPAALDEIDAHPKLTRLPHPNSGEVAEQKHVDALPSKARGRAKSGLTGRELGKQLHEQYKQVTRALNPDFF